MDDINVALSVALVVTALIVIWYARETVRESRKVTKSAQDTVEALQSLLVVAEETARTSRVAAEATKLTIDATLRAYEANERERRVRRLRDIAELVERVFEKAAATANYRRQAWRCIEQREIVPMLVGTQLALPECHRLAGESRAPQVYAVAVLARDEIAEALRREYAQETGGHRAKQDLRVVDDVGQNSP
jgi:hypothetical protein